MSLYVVCVPYEIMKFDDIRLLMEALTPAHLWHGSLRFTASGILLTSEMMDDYQDLRRLLDPFAIRLSTSQYYQLTTQNLKFRQKQ